MVILPHEVHETTELRLLVLLLITASRTASMQLLLLIESSFSGTRCRGTRSPSRTEGTFSGALCARCRFVTPCDRM
jgi:hypothetical protein